MDVGSGYHKEEEIATKKKCIYLYYFLLVIYNVRYISVAWCLLNYVY
jgi:hypothetical protein